MSYKIETYHRNGNSKMAEGIRVLASTCNLTVNSFSSTGWLLKRITITVFGHIDDIARFEKQLPAGIQS